MTNPVLDWKMEAVSSILTFLRNHLQKRQAHHKCVVELLFLLRSGVGVARFTLPPGV